MAQLMTSATEDKHVLVDAYRQRTPASEAQWERASQYLPNGVSRNAVFRRPYPIYFRKASGATLVDLDGNEYLDFCMNLGPILLGHGADVIREPVERQLANGWGYGGPSALEEQVAGLIRDAYPAAENIRFLSTGTEGVIHMMRLARAVTGRDRIIKFIGAYHGAHDGAQFSVRPPADCGYVQPEWVGTPQSQGIPLAQSQETLAVPYNDLASLEQCLEAYRGEIAGIVIDCAMNACGLADPEDGFLLKVQELIHAHGGLLLLDEIVTGFRYGLGGAAEHFGLEPDLVAFGKALGGGAPIGALAGAACKMSMLGIGSDGRAAVDQSGTFSANPITLNGALAFLTYVRDHPEIYEYLDDLGRHMREGIRDIGDRAGLTMSVTGVGSMFQVQAGVERMRRYEDFTIRDVDFRERLYLYMATRGCYLPTPTGSFFLAAAHSRDDVDHFLHLFESFLPDQYGYASHRRRVGADRVP